MKTIKYLSFILFSFLYSFTSKGQIPTYTADAVRFSQTDGGGTARFSGLGGASAALGGDIGSISANPAGLGFYNRSAMAISPVLRIGNYNAQYEGSVTNSVGANFQIPNMGMVFQNDFEEYAGSKWISGAFGLSINQKESFYNSVNYNGTVRPNSSDIVFDFVEFALQPFLDQNNELSVYNNLNSLENDIRAFEDYAYLGYFTEILNPYNLEGGGVILDRYDYDAASDGYLTESVSHRESIDTYGGLTTLDLSYGANYNDMLYLGGSLNVNFLNYRQVRRFREFPDNDILNYLELNEETEMSGSGAALTIGAIYKPLNVISLGFSYTSPTFLSINETQRIGLETAFLDGSGFFREIENDVPAYSLRLPQKLSVGATAFISKYGFVTADLEYVDYTSALYSSTNEAFESSTLEVGREDLQSTVNLKIGAEGRWNILRARLGFTYFDNPYQVFEQNNQSISGGIGVMKENGFFIDATYRLSSFTNPDMDAYQGSSVVTSESNISSLRITLGKNF